MKKTVSLIAVALLLLAFAGCMVNKNTGAITVQNYSDKPASNVKVGNIFIGSVAPGELRTYYFFTDQSAAEISIDGFSLPTASALFSNEAIDLKTNYLYTLELFQSSNDYLYTITGKGMIDRDTVNLQSKL